MGLFETTRGHDWHELIPLLKNLGSACRNVGELTEQRKFLERALSIQDKWCDPDEADLLDTLSCLADVFGVLGDVTQQMKYERRISEIKVRLKANGVVHDHTVEDKPFFSRLMSCSFSQCTRDEVKR